MQGLIARIRNLGVVSVSWRSILNFAKSEPRLTRYAFLLRNWSRDPAMQVQYSDQWATEAVTESLVNEFRIYVIAKCRWKIGYITSIYLAF